jgi:mannose-6-phosphate isomerase-like protein (cupin superfamily)
MKDIEQLEPSCNLDTVRDGRGGIFTFYPEDPVVEFNFNIVNAGNIRGNHHHPEFDEYYVLTSGEGVLIYKDKSNNDKEEFLYLSRGACTRTKKGTSHVFRAITDCTLVVLLTKKWDDCDIPIVHENLGMGEGDHGDPNSEFFKNK